VEDEQQGIVGAESSGESGALLCVTLLAAGYVVGPAGSSVREVSRQGARWLATCPALCVEYDPLSILPFKIQK
jgi:hypothetical protein